MAAIGHEIPYYSTTGSIRYLRRLELYKTEKPYEVTFLPVNVPQPSAQRTNIVLEYWPVEFRDFSSNKEDFSTDIQGFELGHFRTSLSVAELKDLSTLESRYHDEAKLFLENRYKANKICIFDTTVREAKQPWNDSSTLLKNHQILAPTPDCHVDQSPDSVHRRVKHKFPDEAEGLLRQRVQLINIWRPLIWPCHTMPLAMCDWRSTVTDDYTISDHVSPVWEGETLQVYHNTAHEWWFAREMKEDDVFLLKMYDSEAEKPGSNVAMCTPHCSFDWKDGPEFIQPRQSVEIRALVFS